MIELNIHAKQASELAEKRKRLAQMRDWRKQKIMLFDCEADFKDWLVYTKWKHRPVLCKKHEWGFHVTFLDWKPA